MVSKKELPRKVSGWKTEWSAKKSQSTGFKAEESPTDSSSLEEFYWHSRNGRWCTSVLHRGTEVLYSLQIKRKGMSRKSVGIEIIF